MPWEVTGPVQERQRLIEALMEGRHTMTELAQRFGTSRKTIYKWIARFKSEGPAGLFDRGHAAKSHPNATPAEVAAALIRAKNARPTWGPLKLKPLAEDGPEIAAAWPAPSTRSAILDRAGLVKRRRRRRRVPRHQGHLSVAHQANDVWCIDFKGWFRTGDGERCDPLTVTDDYSRMLLCCQSLDRPDFTHVRPALEVVFRQYGLPAIIRSDNGPPFASVAVGGLSPLAVWWVKLGILPERIDPGHPEQNPRHERMHGTLKLECCRPPAATGAAQQLRFNAFTGVYNYERPHQSLGLEPPASFYQPSLRPYPARIEDPQYPAGVAIRRVRSNGQIKWKGSLIFLSEALVGDAIAISESLSGYDVHFGPIALGTIDVKGERLIRRG